MDSQDGSSGALKIIRRSGKLMWNSRKPIMIIVLSYAIPLYALIYAHTFNIRTLAVKLVEIFDMSRTVDPATIPGMIIDSLARFILPDLPIFLGSFLLASLLVLTVLYTVKMGLNEKNITLKSLMIEIREKYKSTVVTQLFAGFLALGYLNFSVSIILAVLILGTLSAGFYVLASLIAISFFLLFVYFDFVWLQGVVASVMETGYEGLTAIGMARAMVEGRRALAFRVNCLLLVVAIVLSLLNSFAMRILGKGEMGLIATEFIFTGIALLMDVFVLTVHAVFYQERRSKPLDGQGARENLIYRRISSDVSIREGTP